MILNSKERRVAGGKAAPVICSAEDGDRIVKAALDAFGSVHILVANAGVLRDRSFAAISEQEWDLVMAVHLRGTFKVRLLWFLNAEEVAHNIHQCAKAVWPIFQKQKYGRIVTTCSQVGICESIYIPLLFAV